MKIRIYYEDTDAGGIVYHVNYIKFCERARSEMFFSSGLDFDENRSFVVVNINANFIKPAVLGDLLEVRSQVVQIKKASVTLRQEIYKIGRLGEACEPKLIFSCDVVLAFLNRSKVAKIDEETAKIFKTNEKF